MKFNFYRFVSFRPLSHSGEVFVTAGSVALAMLCRGIVGLGKFVHFERNAPIVHRNKKKCLKFALLHIHFFAKVAMPS